MPNPASTVRWIGAVALATCFFTPTQGAFASTPLGEAEPVFVITTDGESPLQALRRMAQDNDEVGTRAASLLQRWGSSIPASATTTTCRREE